MTIQLLFVYRVDSDEALMVMRYFTPKDFGYTDLANWVTKYCEDQHESKTWSPVEMSLFILWAVGCGKLPDVLFPTNDSVVRFEIDNFFEGDQTEQTFRQFVRDLNDRLEDSRLPRTGLGDLRMEVKMDCGYDIDDQVLILHHENKDFKFLEWINCMLEILLVHDRSRESELLAFQKLPKPPFVGHSNETACIYRMLSWVLSTIDYTTPSLILRDIFFTDSPNHLELFDLFTSHFEELDPHSVSYCATESDLCRDKESQATLKEIITVLDLYQIQLPRLLEQVYNCKDGELEYVSFFGPNSFLCRSQDILKTIQRHIDRQHQDARYG